MPDPNARLINLAAALEPDLRSALLRLVEADSQAHRYAEVAHRAQRAEDLVDELRRHLAARDSQIARLRDEADDLRSAHELCPPMAVRR